MKQFIITNDIEEFELKGQNFYEKYTVYKLKHISEVNKKFFLKYAKEPNDIVMVIKDEGKLDK